MRRLRLPALAALAALAVRADETTDRVRAAAARCQDSVFVLRSVLAMGPREQRMGSTAVAVDASGLLAAPNIEAMVPVREGAEISSKDFKLVLADGKEAEAKVVGRDTDFSLIFLKLSGKDAPALAAPPAAAKPLELGDEVLLFSRLSPEHPEPVCQVTRVSSVIQKPRLMYLLSENLGPGCVAVNAQGELLGLSVVVREKDPDTGREKGMLVILPMAQILEAARSLPAEQEAPKAEDKAGEEAPK